MSQSDRVLRERRPVNYSELNDSAEGDDAPTAANSGDESGGYTTALDTSLESQNSSANNSL